MEDQKFSLAEEELEQYRKEKEKIRNLVGQIGGKSTSKLDTGVNILFIILLVLLFGFDLLRHVLDISIPLPLTFSLDIGILLVSAKIIWMI